MTIPQSPMQPLPPAGLQHVMLCICFPVHMHSSALSTGVFVQVKARVREVQLHRDSPLGDTLLECYSCGSRNTFALGFVPVKSENSVVLLCRDHPASASGIKELNLDLTLWQPLIEDRAFMPWLVKQPTQQVSLYLSSGCSSQRIAQQPQCKVGRLSRSQLPHLPMLWAHAISTEGKITRATAPSAQALFHSAAARGSASEEAVRQGVVTSAGDPAGKAPDPGPDLCPGRGLAREPGCHYR